LTAPGAGVLHRPPARVERVADVLERERADQPGASWRH
jgi:hypothetical protein